MIFCKVSRIEARSEQFDMYMQLDVNTEIYPLHVGDKFTMVLAPTLSLDGTPDSGYYMQVINLILFILLVNKLDFFFHCRSIKNINTYCIWIFVVPLEIDVFTCIDTPCLARISSPLSLLKT